MSQTHSNTEETAMHLTASHSNKLHQTQRNTKQRTATHCNVMSQNRNAMQCTTLFRIKLKNHQTTVSITASTTTRTIASITNSHR
jgi:hypothetical protein